MTMVETVSELEIVEVLDFDPALVCEVLDVTGGVPICDELAVWVVRCKVCTATYLRCEPHRVDLVEWCERSDFVKCSACKTHRRTLYELVDILPLGRAS